MTRAKSHTDAGEWQVLEAIVAKYVGIQQSPQTLHHNNVAPSGSAVGVTKPKPKPTSRAASPKPTPSKRKVASPVSERTHELWVGLFESGSPITPPPANKNPRGDGCGGVSVKSSPNAKQKNPTSRGTLLAHAIEAAFGSPPSRCHRITRLRIRRIVCDEEACCPPEAAIVCESWRSEGRA